MSPAACASPHLFHVTETSRGPAAGASSLLGVRRTGHGRAVTHLLIRRNGMDGSNVSTAVRLCRANRMPHKPPRKKSKGLQVRWALHNYPTCHEEPQARQGRLNVMRDRSSAATSMREIGNNACASPHLFHITETSRGPAAGASSLLGVRRTGHGRAVTHLMYTMAAAASSSTLEVASCW
jgi:hypothetical protein